MAVTLAVSRSQIPAVAIGGLRGRLVTVTPDTSYPTGGYSIAPGDIGLSEILGAIQVGIFSGAVTTLATWVYNSSTQKLQAFGTAGSATGLTEIANATNLSAQINRILFVGV